MLCNKYLGTKPLTQVQYKPGDSQFWTGLMKVKFDFLKCGTFRVENGSQIRFWKDKWLGDETLMDQYPDLFWIVHGKHDTVAHILSFIPLNVSFRRPIVGQRLLQWHGLCQN